MKSLNIKRDCKNIISLVFIVLSALYLSACGNAGYGTAAESSAVYIETDHNLERNGINLHLDSVTLKGKKSEKNILLVHGLTYSSMEFDVDYEDYSLVRYLADHGYNVWKLDISGYGRSDEVNDGFMPDSDYAALDIEEAVNKICREMSVDKIDILGWSWGTVTSSGFAVKHPEMIDHYVMYAPILTGLGENDVLEAFHKNTWEHAASDFQFNEEGSIDPDITDPVVVDMYCSICWKYDKDSSPNGGRKDLCVSKTKKLINLSEIIVKTLVICGDNDPYMNMDAVNSVLNELPQGSSLEIIKGASHVAMYEKPYYKIFQEKIMDFLEK